MGGTRIINVTRKPRQCPFCKAKNEETTVDPIIYGTGDWTEPDFLLHYGKPGIIASLSKLYDSALMLRLYGDNGKGVCLVFDVKDAGAKPILYIGEKASRYQQLRTAIRNLKKKKWQRRQEWSQYLYP